MNDPNLNASDTWRVFCAIELPAGASARVTAHIDRLRRQYPPIAASWNHDGKFHLTLKFMGEIPPARVERLSLAADRAISNLSTFNLVIAGAGVFPNHGMPKVLWLGINDPDGQLADLQTRLEEECAQEGFSKEERAFHPHLTIARLRKPDGARELAGAHKQSGFEALEISVSELLVIRSELSSTGSRYTIISSHRLGRGKGVGCRDFTQK